MNPEVQAEVEGKGDVDNDVEMKDEAEAVEEGPKVSLPWAFIDCEIDSLIELVGESFATDPQAGAFLLGLWNTGPKSYLISYHTYPSYLSFYSFF